MTKTISPPGPKRGFPLKTLLSFRKDPLEYLENLTESYGDISLFKLGRQKMVLVNSPEAIKDILVTNSNIFTKGRALQMAKIVLGEGLLTSEGENHKRQRKLIQPAFNHQNIQYYASIMVEHTANHIEKWHDKQEIDLGSEMMAITLSIVCKALFNFQLETDTLKMQETMSVIVDMFNEITNPFYYILKHLPLPKQKKYQEAREFLNLTIKNIIKEKRTNTGEGKDLLSILINAQDEDDKKGMTDTQVKDEVMTLFLAGHETTANLMLWTIYLLSQNPDIENKLYTELQSVIGNRLPDYKDIPNLVYTKKIITESMRLYPPAWVIGRINLEEYHVNGYSFDPGTVFLMSQYVMHRDKKYYSEPEKFIPERWNDDNKIPKHAYFPFGGGPRICIGEMFAWSEGILLLATICQKWKFKMQPNQNIELLPLITLRPKNKMLMEITKR